MTLRLIAFTPRGTLLARELAEKLEQGGHRCDARSFRPFPDGTGQPALPCLERTTLAPWTEAAFREAEGLIFISACGIAVRAAAPFLRDKHTDPAVVAVDEGGRFAVALLSGHTGGANRLAREVAEAAGAQPVVTTATDGAGLLAIDDWAAQNGWRLDRPERVKAISAALVSGGTVSFSSDLPVCGPLPRGYLPGEVSPALWFTLSAAPSQALKVVPPALWVGIGCRRGATGERIAAAVEAALAAGDLTPLAVAGAATISIKGEEPGLLALCREKDWPLRCFPPEELALQPGEFTPSPFVKETTGVDNVCERAAVAASGGGRLLVKKTVLDGVTAAVAACPVAVRLGPGETGGTDRPGDRPWAWNGKERS